MHRFFVDFTPAEGQEVALTGALAHQLGRVLRLRPGATIVLLDGSGREFTVELTGFAATPRGHLVTGRAVAGRRNGGKPSPVVTLYAAPLKGDHLALTLQRCTEVGAAALVPILTERTVAGGEAPEGAGRLERSRRIVRRAAERAGRGRIPSAHSPLRFADAVRATVAARHALIPWKEGRARTLRQTSGALLGAAGPPVAVSPFIGPEG